MPVLAPAADQSVRTDLELMQGVWTSVAGPREARFLIAGHRFTFEFTDGELYIVQARPETVASQRSGDVFESYALTGKGKVLVASSTSP